MNPEDFTTLRQSTGLSQPQAADALGVSERTVSRWETGAAPIPWAAPLALLTIRRERAAMGGRHYPMSADVVQLMRREEIPQELAVRALGAH